MKHENFAIRNELPTANICKQKSRLKIYQDKNIYLNNGDNFEIELFNPTTSSVLAKISIDGESISLGGIIIEPGQRIYLERYISTNNKFLYQTYQVDNTPEVKNAIKNNGDISISFYKKSIPNYIYFDYNPMRFSQNFGDNYWHTTSPYNNIRSGYFGTLSKSVCVTDSMETGRVGKGDTSNQTFTTSNEQFSALSTNTIEYKLLPMSTLMVTNDEISIRQYCTECGKKIKQSWKYCPSCSNKI